MGGATVDAGRAEAGVSAQGAQVPLRLPPSASATATVTSGTLGVVALARDGARATEILSVGAAVVGGDVVVHGRWWCCAL